jgi:hypothetical protein
MLLQVFVIVVNSLANYIHDVLSLNIGGQTTMLYDVSRRFPWHYVHRHKLTDKRRPPGFNQEEPAKIVQMVNEIDKLIRRTVTVNMMTCSCQFHIHLVN